MNTITMHGTRDLRTPAQRLEDWRRWAALSLTPTKDQFLTELAEATAGFGRVTA